MIHRKNTGFTERLESKVLLKIALSFNFVSSHHLGLSKRTLGLQSKSDSIKTAITRKSSQTFSFPTAISITTRNTQTYPLYIPRTLPRSRSPNTRTRIHNSLHSTRSSSSNKLNQINLSSPSLNSSPNGFLIYHFYRQFTFVLTISFINNAGAQIITRSFTGCTKSYLDSQMVTCTYAHYFSCLSTRG